MHAAPLAPHPEDGSWHVLRNTELRHSSPVQHRYPSPQLEPSPWQYGRVQTRVPLVVVLGSHVMPVQHVLAPVPVQVLPTPPHVALITHTPPWHE